MVVSARANEDSPNTASHNKFKKAAASLLVALSALGVAGCSNDATVASKNLSEAADNFQISRRIVFYNSITDTVMAEIVGFCSLDIGTPRVAKVTCKTPDDQFEKHYLGLSDNVTYFAVQTNPASVSTFQYRVILKPQSIIPDFDLRGNVDELRSATRPTTKPAAAQVFPTASKN